MTKSYSYSKGGRKVEVGEDYQAVLPSYIPVTQRRKDQCPEKALLLWSPTTNITDQRREYSHPPSH